MNTKGKAAGIITGVSLVLNAFLIVALTLILTGNGHIIGLDLTRESSPVSGSDTRGVVAGAEDAFLPLETVPAVSYDEGYVEESGGIAVDSTEPTAAVTTAVEYPYEPADTTVRTTAKTAGNTSAKPAATTAKTTTTKATTTKTTTTTQKPASGDNDGSWINGWY